MAVIKADRNDPCPCGSGLKFKKCCGTKRIPKFEAKTLSSEALPGASKVSSLFSKRQTPPMEKDPKQEG